MTSARSGLLASVMIGVIVAGCATGPAYTKRTDGETAAIDALDCNKAAVVAHRRTRRKYKNPTGEKALRKAAAAAKAAARRCLLARGWKRRQ